MSTASLRTFLIVLSVTGISSFTQNGGFQFQSRNQGTTLTPVSPRKSCSTKRYASTNSYLTGDSSDGPHVQEVFDLSKPMGFYIHIPYCRRRCRYCDFAIVPVGDDITLKEKDGFLKMDQDYKAALLKEIELLTASLKTTISLKSIYFGGGTPSLAPISTIQVIMKTLLTNEKINLEQNAEITMEMDPGTFDLNHAEGLKELGFNRISLGVQSFDDEILENIGRVHRLQDIEDAVGIIQSVFGEEANYSIDLISGLPGLTCAKWAETLETALSMSPPPVHLSLYDMQIEKNTVFGEWYKEHVVDDGEDPEMNESKGTVSVENTLNLSRIENVNTKILPLPDSDECGFMYKYASGYLKAKGFDHYEISSYARVNTHGESNIEEVSKRSVHNQIYWDMEGNWCAIGMGSTSSLDRKRFSRPKQFSTYLSWIEREHKNFSNKSEPFVPDNNHLTWAPWLPKNGSGGIDDDYLLDVILTRLRTKEGLSLRWVESNVGKETLEKILRGAELGLQLNLAEKSQSVLRLKDPEGFLFSNSIISTIFYELS